MSLKKSSHGYWVSCDKVGCGNQANFPGATDRSVESIANKHGWQRCCREWCCWVCNGTMHQHGSSAIFDAYQAKAHSFAQYPDESDLEYLALGLTSEAGEVAGKVKKWLRGDYGDNRIPTEPMAAEIGDVLWYLAELCTTLGMSLGEVAQMNIDKLTKRQAAGTIKGSGDER